MHLKKNYNKTVTYNKIKISILIILIFSVINIILDIISLVNNIDSDSLASIGISIFIFIILYHIKDWLSSIYEDERVIVNLSKKAQIFAPTTPLLLTYSQQEEPDLFKRENLEDFKNLFEKIKGVSDFKRQIKLFLREIVTQLKLNFAELMIIDDQKQGILKFEISQNPQGEFEESVSFSKDYEEFKKNAEIKSIKFLESENKYICYFPLYSGKALYGFIKIISENPFNTRVHSILQYIGDILGLNLITFKLTNEIYKLKSQLMTQHSSNIPLKIFYNLEHSEVNPLDIAELVFAITGEILGASGGILCEEKNVVKSCNIQLTDRLNSAIKSFLSAQRKSESQDMFYIESAPSDFKEAGYNGIISHSFIFYRKFNLIFLFKKIRNLFLEEKNFLKNIYIQFNLISDLLNIKKELKNKIALLNMIEKAESAISKQEDLYKFIKELFSEISSYFEEPCALFISQKPFEAKSSDTYCELFKNFTSKFDERIIANFSRENLDKKKIEFNQKSYFLYKIGYENSWGISAILMIPSESAVSIIYSIINLIIKAWNARLYMENISNLKKLNDKILETTPSGLIVTEGSGRVKLINPFAKKILSKLNANQSDLSSIIKNIVEERKKAFRIFNSELQIFLEIKKLKVDKEIFITIIDVSELIKARKKIERLNRLAALGKMAAGVAHEIRNPLGGIKVLTGYLKTKLENKFEKVLNDILEAIQSIERIVNDLLDTSIQRQSELIKFNLKEVEEEIKRNLAELIENTKNRIKFLWKVKDTEVYLDKLKLIQIVTNLVLNAVCAIPDSGKVEVELEILDIHDKRFIEIPAQLNALTIEEFECVKDKELYIQVVDTGIGMDEETKEKAFDPFFSTRSKIAKNLPLKSGTGLGLTIVHNIVEQFEGLIDIKSKVGEGTRMIIYLPYFIKKGDSDEQK